MTEFQSGEPPAESPARLEQFVALYADHQRRLYQYVLALLPSAQDADDLLQDIVLVLWKKFSQFEPGTSFFAWACRIAYLRVLNFRRTKARQVEIFDQDVLEQLAVDAAQEDDFLAAHLAALTHCLELLTPRERDLIRRRYEGASSGKQIADELERSPNSVYKSLGRIRKQLLDCVHRTIAARGGECR